MLQDMRDYTVQLSETLWRDYINRLPNCRYLQLRLQFDTNEDVTNFFEVLLAVCIT